MAHGIILSKDRPAQLHLCLQSILKNGKGIFDTISVLYDVDSTESQFAYNQVEKAFPSVSFVDEVNYYEDIKELVDVDYELTAFFTDDDIMYSEIPVEKFHIKSLFRELDPVGCLSLRLGLNTVIQDPYIQSQTQPPSSGIHYIENGKFIAWQWRDCPPYMNFGYPMSVDGHIFRTSELANVLSQCKFNNPNQQEIAMSSKADMIGPYMVALPKSVIVNTPLNRVQSTCMNRAGEIHGQKPADMIDKYLSGYRLDLNSLNGVDIIGCHQEIELKWITK